MGPHRMNAHTFNTIIQLLVMIYNQVRAEGTHEVRFIDGRIREVNLDGLPILLGEPS